MTPKMLMIYSLLVFSFCVSPLYANYNAVVYNLYPASTYESQTAWEVLLENTKQYVEKIGQTVQKDIIVFPEYGLTSTEALAPEKYKEFAIQIPDANPTVSLCIEGQHKVLRDIACVTKTQKIYTVINILEIVNNDTVYNTNVVFNRDGAILAKYRKINLFGNEKKLLKAGTELVTFTTDFNVKFGLMICYDILFPNPSLTLLDQGVTDIIYTTAWFSQIPFLAAASVQDGYAASTGVNLLASSYNYPKEKLGGGGIYNLGTSTVQISTVRETTSVQSEVLPNSLANMKNECHETKRQVARGIGLTKPDVSGFITTNDIAQNKDSYNFKLLTQDKSEFSEKFCHRGFCCEFSAKTKEPIKDSDPKYMFAVYKDEQINWSGCGLVACETKNVTTCGLRPASAKNVVFTNIEVKSVTLSDNDYTIASTLDLNLEPITYKYCRTPELATIAAQTTQASVVNFGIFTVNSASSLQLNIILAALFSILVVFFK